MRLVISARCVVTFVCLFVCLFGALGVARAEDRWLGPDKGLHFGASAVLAGGAYTGAMWFVEDPLQRAAVGMGTSLVFGIGKELYDATGRGDPSWRDLTWDFVGCTFGAGISLLVDFALRESTGPHVRQQRLPVIAAW